jgi:DnaJ-class molecular chaperone
MNKAVLCPVCNGTGQVPSGFYNPGGQSITPVYEVCRSCNGKGYIALE